jgi:hypothetical protein
MAEVETSHIRPKTPTKHYVYLFASGWLAHGGGVFQKRMVARVPGR